MDTNEGFEVQELDPKIFGKRKAERQKLAKMSKQERSAMRNRSPNSRNNEMPRPYTEQPSEATSFEGDRRHLTVRVEALDKTASNSTR